MTHVDAETPTSGLDGEGTPASSTVVMTGRRTRRQKVLAGAALAAKLKKITADHKGNSDLEEKVCALCVNSVKVMQINISKNDNIFLS